MALDQVEKGRPRQEVGSPKTPDRFGPKQLVLELEADCRGLRKPETQSDCKLVCICFMYIKSHFIYKIQNNSKPLHMKAGQESGNTSEL